MNDMCRLCTVSLIVFTFYIFLNFLVQIADNEEAWASVLMEAKVLRVL